jgi:integrase
MTQHNAANERVKRRYFLYLREAKRQSEASVDAAAKALARFEELTLYRDFKAFNIEQVVAFKRRLAESTDNRRRLSKATLYTTFAHLKRFFTWLTEQPGYRSRLRYGDAEYFNLSEKDTRVATARRERPHPTLDQVKHVIANMPTESDVDRRNRALIALTLLTAARDSAIASLKLKHVDLTAGSIYQDAREVKTKYSKSFTTFFLPVGEDIRQIFVDWVVYLREQRLWGNEDPLFPATETRLGPAGEFVASGLKRQHWSTASPIRSIFREAFERVGLPYFNPHSIRKTLTQFGETHCRTPEEFKALSQNLGHESPLTTLRSYGAVTNSRQGELIRTLARPDRVVSGDVATFAEAVAKAVEKRLETGKRSPD